MNLEELIAQSREVLEGFLSGETWTAKKEYLIRKLRDAARGALEATGNPAPGTPDEESVSLVTELLLKAFVDRCCRALNKKNPFRRGTIP